MQLGSLLAPRLRNRVRWYGQTCKYYFSCSIYRLLRTYGTTQTFANRRNSTRTLFVCLTYTPCSGQMQTSKYCHRLANACEGLWNCRVANDSSKIDRWTYIEASLAWGANRRCFLAKSDRQQYRIQQMLTHDSNELGRCECHLLARP